MAKSQVAIALLSGLLLPLSLGPTWKLHIADANPLYELHRALRDLSTAR